MNSSISRTKLLVLASLLVLAQWVPGGLTQAQSCRPAVVNYIVRDEAGKVLQESALTLITKQLPEKIDDAHLSIDHVYFAKDGTTFYSPYSTEASKGKKVASLEFVDSAQCILKLRDVTLSYHNMKMRLVFNIDINRRHVVVESLPFQDGTFELDLNGWSMDKPVAIPATRWKKKT